MPHVDGRSDLDIALGFVAEVRDLEATTEEALLLQLGLRLLPDQRGRRRAGDVAGPSAVQAAG